ARRNSYDREPCLSNAYDRQPCLSDGTDKLGSLSCEYGQAGSLSYGEVKHARYERAFGEVLPGQGPAISAPLSQRAIHCLLGHALLFNPARKARRHEVFGIGLRTWGQSVGHSP